eukprot:COSAG06_NODE_36361_length_448_cov_0.593123_2_plen_24_part_01
MAYWLTTAGMVASAGGAMISLLRM